MRFRSSRTYIALLAVATLVVLAGGGYEAWRAVRGYEKQPSAVFKVHCKISHVSMDDPIVSPGEPGNSHLHNFFGNSSVDAYSTTTGMSQAASTCSDGSNEVDHSAYWFPALMKDGVPVPSDGTYINAYYRDGRGEIPITPFPYGLRMIAGNMYARTAQLPFVSIFGCSPTAGGRLGTYLQMPTCPDGRSISGTLTFPNCWDGEHLDSADHTSHMSYSSPDHGCDGAHPVRVPQLVLRIVWVNTANTDGAQYSLASGGQYSLHADFWNLWAPAAQSQLVAKCLNVVTDCSEDPRSRVTGAINFPETEWAPASR